MRIGLQIPLFTSKPEDFQSYSVAAEKLGYDSVWFGDHLVIPAQIESPYPFAERFAADVPIFPSYNYMHAGVICGFLAAATSTIDIGIGVFVLPMRNPVVFAKELATIDVLSSGRVIAGIGCGWMKEEFEAIGVPFSERGKRTDEWLAIMRALWSDDQPVAFSGNYHSFPAVYCQPTPVTPGGPRMWGGGHSIPSLRRCVRSMKGWQAVELPPKEFAQLNARLDQLLLEAERQPSEVERSLFTRLRLSSPNLDDAMKTITSYRDAGCDHLVVSGSPGRSIEENIDRVTRLRNALDRGCF